MSVLVSLSFTVDKPDVVFMAALQTLLLVNRPVPSSKNSHFETRLSAKLEQNLCCANEFYFMRIRNPFHTNGFVL